jgi:hypothetical protein
MTRTQASQSTAGGTNQTSNRSNSDDQTLRPESGDTHAENREIRQSSPLAERAENRSEVAPEEP